jgi:RNA methyltransferase, TrmH family
MISKNKLKYIVSLQKKKARDEEQLYLIEGDKLVKEYLMSGMRLRLLAAKPEFIALLMNKEKELIGEIYSVSQDELERMSTLKTPHNAVALVSVPEWEFDPDMILEGLCAVLDSVNDPGNLGTIVRSAAWFGIKNIVCSENSVELYNPKVIQASMGAVLHVKVHYCDLRQFLGTALKKGIPVFGTMMEGESIYNLKPGNKGIILLGNESKGISDDLLSFVSKKIMIPRFNDLKYGIDSLNVSMAASIVFSEFTRGKSRKR